MEKTMKWCDHCQELKCRETDFHKDATKPDGYSYKCAECTRRHAKERRVLFPGYDNVKTAAAKLRNRQYSYNYLLSHPCVDCGETDPVVLEYDHVRGVKEFNISQLLRQGYAVQRVMDEIAKCDVRCANCHRRATAIREGWYAWLLPDGEELDEPA